MYPEARMISAMKVWKLPIGKESVLSEMCQNGQYFLQEKIDGYWYEFEKTKNHSYLFSRNESKVTGELSEKGANVPHIMEALSWLPADTILIGEIYYPGGTSKTVTTVMGCLPELAIKRQENNPIHYYIHDIIMYDGVNLIGTGAEDRYKILEAIWHKHALDKYNFLRLAVKVDEDLEGEISRILKSGGEGVVLKKRDYPYTPGKRPAWSTIKIKQMDSIDLVCIGLCDATREYTGSELQDWEYWEKGKPCFYDCFEEDHCWNGWGCWEKVQGKYYNKYICNPDGGKFTKDNERKYVPVTKPYFLGWKTTIKIGAYDENGELKELGTVASGLTDEDKKEMTFLPERWIGKVISLDCMSINKKDHTLRHPVFKGKRDDKPAKDCLISEIFK